MSSLDRLIRYRPPAETADRQTHAERVDAAGSADSAIPRQQTADPAPPCHRLTDPAEREAPEISGNVVTLCRSADSAMVDDEERLAILEYDGEIPPEWAAAFHQVCK